MATEATPRSAWRAVATLPARDWLVVGLILFFTAVALTIELYWLLHHQEMNSRNDPTNHIISLYWPVDRSWRIQATRRKRHLIYRLRASTRL
jgi:hypothetical protein